MRYPNNQVEGNETVQTSKPSGGLGNQVLVSNPSVMGSNPIPPIFKENIMSKKYTWIIDTNINSDFKIGAKVSGLPEFIHNNIIDAILSYKKCWAPWSDKAFILEIEDSTVNQEYTVTKILTPESINQKISLINILKKIKTITTF